jgi:ribosome-associated protein
MTQVTDTIMLNDREINERFVRATGPGWPECEQGRDGGRTAHRYREVIAAARCEERLIALGGRRMTTDGVLVVVSPAHRSQAQNRDAARAQLVALLKRAAKPAEETYRDEAGLGGARGKARLKGAT